MKGDKDRNGRLDSREIHEALRTGGFNMSYPTSHALYRKYDTTGYGLDMAQWIALVRLPRPALCCGNGLNVF
jgi:Ca2+-binding EF-hand superfamily protein